MKYILCINLISNNLNNIDVYIKAILVIILNTTIQNIKPVIHLCWNIILNR